MLHTQLNKDEAILTLQPEGALTKNDFDNAVQIIDPFIEKQGKLNGVIISTKSFPKWDSFASLIRHLKFVRNHHKKIKRLAFVTDSIIGNFSEKISSHFVAAEIKTFPFEQLENAKKWILEK